MIQHLNHHKTVLSGAELAERVLRIACEFCYVPAAREISIYMRNSCLADCAPRELGDLEESVRGSGRYICHDASPEIVYYGMNRWTARPIKSEPAREPKP